MKSIRILILVMFTTSCVTTSGTVPLHRSAAAADEGHFRGAHVLGCGLLFATSALAADILLESLPEFILGVGLTLLAGRHGGRACLYPGSNAGSPRGLSGFCRETSSFLTLAPIALVESAGDSEILLGVGIAGTALLAGVIQEKGCGDGGNPPDGPLEMRP